MSAMMREPELLKRLAAAEKQARHLRHAVEMFLERADEPPEPNCSCHLSPPCNDCVDYGGLREAFSVGRELVDVYAIKVPA